ncbi:MAG: GGDEF domain-containing protein [Candidatus Goldiibacteriota bacterium]
MKQKKTAEKKIAERLEKTEMKTIVIISYAAIIILGAVDYISGHRVSFMTFYAIPIAALAWYGKRIYAVSGSIIAVGLWLAVDMAYIPQYRNFIIPYWNAFTAFFFYLIIAFLLSSLGREMQKQKKMAETDYLTKIDNRRSFNKKIIMELERAKRHRYPVTIIYMDVDNFKRINDTYGHDTGDIILVKAASVMRRNIRISDIAARLGGDEFAMFLPEMEKKGAEKLVEKLRIKLKKECCVYVKRVTFSFGVTVYKRVKANMNARQMLKEADRLMYKIKKKGKNAAVFKEI